MAISPADEHPEVRKFLHEHRVATLATVNDENAPHAAVIYFEFDDDFNFYFVTKERTAKNRNLQHNPHAALAVYDAPSQTTVQVFGTASLVHDKRRVEELVDAMQEITHATSGSNHKTPVSKMDAGEYVAYCLKPKTVRMAQFVKAEYPPVDPLFEVVVFPEDEL